MREKVADITRGSLHKQNAQATGLVTGRISESSSMRDVRCAPPHQTRSINDVHFVTRSRVVVNVAVAPAAPGPDRQVPEGGVEERGSDVHVRRVEEALQPGCVWRNGGRSKTSSLSEQGT
jgi:hypothetical protein